MNTCKKCLKNPALLNGLCESCQLSRIRFAHYKEHSMCRDTINRLLKDMPNLTLYKLAFWTEYDTVPIIPSDNVRAQARKMLIENRSKQP